MKYVCEFCNKKFDTAEEATRCEEKHRKKEAEAATRKNAESTISDALNAFIGKYKAMPKIVLDTGNYKILFGTLETQVNDAINAIFKLLTEF